VPGRSAQTATRFADDLKLLGTVVQRTRRRLDDRWLRLRIAALLLGAIAFTAALSWLLVTVF
jgi:hypothetical protein